MDLELDNSWLVVEILVETVGWLWRFKCFGDLSFTGEFGDFWCCGDWGEQSLRYFSAFRLVWEWMPGEA